MHLRNGMIRQRNRWLGCCLLAGIMALAWSPIAARANSTVRQRVQFALTAGQEKQTESVIELTGLLCDDDADVRAAAAWALTQLGDASAPALPQLTDGLSDPESRVRLGSATAIGQLKAKGHPAEAALIEAAQDRHSDVRCAAFAALREIGVTEMDAAIEAIQRGLQAGDPQVQFEAVTTASSLLKQCDANARRNIASGLFPALTSQADEVRLAATVLATDLGYDAGVAIAALVKNVDDFDDTVKTATRQALTQFVDSVDSKWDRMSSQQRDSLRWPSEIAVRTLQGQSSKSPQIARLVERFQSLMSEVQLASGEQSSGNDVKQLGANDSLEPEAPEITEPARLDPAVESSATASAGSTPWMWLGGLAALGAVIWLVRLGLTKEELPIFIPAKPDEVAMAPTDFVAHLATPELAAAIEAKPAETPTPATTDIVKPVSAKAPTTPAKSESKPQETLKPNKPSADLDFIDAKVLPAVLASVPGGELPGDVARRATSPATTPEGKQPLNATARREVMNQLADHGLAATAQLTRGMNDPDAVVRWRTASAVGAVHSATLQPLLDAVGSTDAEVRRVAATSIRGFGREVVPAFTNALKDQSSEVREAAANALGRIGRGAIEALIPLAFALKDPEPQVRAAAAMALASLGASAGRASGNLQQVLTDSSPSVRARAAFALGKIGPIAKGTVPDLIRLLSDSDPSVRRAAATALGGIGPDAKSAIPTLQSALGDSDVGVRRCAVTTLGLLAPNESVAALQAALTDSDLQVRTVAQTAIQKVAKSNRNVPLNRAA